MSKEYFLHLQHSEAIVAQMAATIFASFIQNKELNETNENELVERSLLIAVKLASRADELVKSDEEWVKKDNGSAYLA